VINIIIGFRDMGCYKYCGRFMALSFRDHSLMETQQMQLFTVNLKEPIHIDVAL
jgi:hypothetical protein